MSKNFSLVNKTRGTLPPAPFERIKNVLLGKAYDLSFALITPTEARAVTRKTKRTDNPSNVLAFPLSKRSGEILICPATARKQAPSYGLDPQLFIVRLFIHGCLHLAGYRHSSTMDRRENQIAQRFDF